MKLCIECGEPSEQSRCAEHQLPARDKPSASSRGYNAAWSRLSQHARRLQPWCSDCQTGDDLTGDHLVWPATKLEHVDVVCRTCNSKRGASRSLTGRAVDPQRADKDPRGMAKFLTLIENGSHLGGRGDG